jgi:CIC family chloride channel protein
LSLDVSWLKIDKPFDRVIRFRGKEFIQYLRTSNASYFLIFSILVGIGAGFGAILFRWLIQQFHHLFFVEGENVLDFMGRYYIILIPAIGGLIIGPLIHFVAREAKGHGVPEVISSMVIDGGKIRLRVPFVKAIASSICIGSGGSVGREGPIIQIGSALGSAIGQFFKLDEEKTKTLVACGAAAGIAATFNAPLGGIFFALEVILREYVLRNLSSVVLSSVTATVISRHYLGNSPAFQIPVFQFNGISDIPFYIVFGVLTAMMAWLFIKALYKTEDVFNNLQIPEYFKPAIGGLIIGLIALFFPQVLGVGYEAIENSINKEFALGTVVALVFLKIIATSVTLGSGGSGGIFAPSLFIGALLGEAFGKVVSIIFPSIIIPPGAFALVGMAAVFAGASHAPISAILLLFEMTGNYKILPPLMITCVISVLLVRWMSKYSIYTLKLMRKGIDIDQYKVVDFMESISVSEAMVSNVFTVIQSNTVKNVGLKIKSTNHRGFPVLDNDGKLVGIVTRKDINKALSEGKAENEVAAIMTTNITICYPDESLEIALHKMAEKNVGRLPVVSRDNKEKLIGLLTRKSLVKAYNQALEREKLNVVSRDPQ